MEGESLIQLIEDRKKYLYFYSPYNYIQNISKEIQFQYFIKDKINNFSGRENHFIYTYGHEGYSIIFLYEYLAWDSDFLQKPCFKLFTVLYSINDATILTQAIRTFKEHLYKNQFSYLFIDIPSEDVFLIQALGYAGLKLVETRFHYYKEDLNLFEEERFKVRKALESDVENLFRVASVNRNEYDRLHADFNFPENLADKYLGTYIQAAVNGFCDAVLVPDEKDIPADSFLAISLLKKDSATLSCPMARVVLTAVAPSNKGWHKKLVSETIFLARSEGATYLLMTTQSTNRAVFRTCEKLNFKLGATSHILTN